MENHNKTSYQKKIINSDLYFLYIGRNNKEEIIMKLKKLITTILAAIAGKLGIKALGAAITGKSTGIGGKISTSLAAGSKTIPIVSGVLDAGATFVDNYYVQDKTAGYSAGSAIGSGVGTGVGVWGGAKLGAMAGTAIAPGIGTAIGTVIGAIAGGTIGKFAGKTVTEAGMDYAGYFLQKLRFISRAHNFWRTKFIRRL